MDIFATQMLSLTSDFLKLSIYTINVQSKFKYFVKVLRGVLWKVTGYQHPENSVQFKIDFKYLYFILCCEKVV